MENGALHYRNWDSKLGIGCYKTKVRKAQERAPLDILKKSVYRTGFSDDYHFVKLTCVMASFPGDEAAL